MTPKMRKTVAIVTVVAMVGAIVMPLLISVAGLF